jgi:predicted nucleotidyltransferase
MSIGITAQEQQIIIDILNKYSDKYSFYYYGSRVKGTFEKNSDLDILIKGNEEMPLNLLGEIKEAFDNSKLSYVVNFSDYYSLDKDFYNRIEKDLLKYDTKIINHSSNRKILF